MNYEQALEVLKRGGKVARGGKVYALQRGVVDVTDPEKPQRVFVHDEKDEEGQHTAQPGFGEEARAAEDFEAHVELEPEAEPEVVAPEAVDEVLHEESHADVPHEPPHE